MIKENNYLPPFPPLSLSFLYIHILIYKIIASFAYSSLFLYFFLSLSNISQQSPIIIEYITQGDSTVGSQHPFFFFRLQKLGAFKKSHSPPLLKRFCSKKQDV